MDGSISLSELLQRVGKTIGAAFPEPFWVVTEILEMHQNRSGHCYLELIEKSDKNEAILARAKGTIWSSRYSMLRPFFETSTGTRLQSGIKILCKATVEFHSQWGFSLNITDIDPAYTLGDLARKKQEVILSLREDGVMDMNRELPFPLVPQHIAVISSETAAGYGDFMDSIRKNKQGFRFSTTLYPAIMQGDETPGSIMSALDRVFESADQFDVVVIIRGGGSRADLEAYNDYDLAYYITQFPLPVLTGIGHERDESVVDMVAAKGLKTPTAVAEYLIDQLLSFEFHLSAQFDKLSSTLGQIVTTYMTTLDRYRVDLVHLAGDLLRRRSDYLDQKALILGQEIRNSLSRKKDHLTLLETRTGLVDPQNILKRGYSMTLLDGRVLSGVSEVNPGDILETRLRGGKIISKVSKTQEQHDKRKD